MDAKKNQTHKLGDNRRARRVLESPDDPHRLARLYLRNHATHPDGLTLRYWRGEWYRWTGNAYRTVPEEELRARLAAFIKRYFDRVNQQEQRRARRQPVARKVTVGLVRNVLLALMGEAVLPADTHQPAWLGGDGPFPAEEVLATSNGLVHLPTLRSHPPTPRFFTANALDYAFDPNAPEPKGWLRFLSELWPDDPESVQLLQEWAGYCLVPDTSQQKIALLVGPKRSGKGTIARVLESLVGADNVAGPTLSSLATSFGLWPLLGRTLAIISDARLSGRADAAVIVERLLSISGEDKLTVERKHLTPIHNAKLNVRFMLLTNELPKLNDASGAVSSRVLLLRMTKSFYGQEDPGLTNRLLAERSGILLWALAGLHRLRERGHFTQPKTGQELLDQLEDLTSPISAFVNQCCKLGSDKQVPKLKLYEEWKSWCKAEGRDHPGTNASFGRDLLAAFPQLRSAHPRIGGKQVYAYSGIDLRGPAA